MNKEKKIPTVLGILILLITVFATTYLTKLTTFLSSKASSDCIPVNIQITNLTHQSADLSFLTPQECLVDVNINNQLISDSFQSISPKSKIHYFQIDGLEQDSVYQYILIANGKEIKNDQFIIKTHLTISGSIPDSNLAWGKILQNNQKPASVAIIYLNIPGAAPMSSFITSIGNWNIPLSVSYNDQKDSWFIPPKDTDEEIIVLSQDGQTMLLTGNTSSNNPVADIIIGQGFSLNEKNGQETSTSIGNIPTVQQTEQTTEKKLDILNPQDGESLFTQRPEFFGTAPIGVLLKIKLNSSIEFNSQVQSDSSGNWRWDPGQSLSPGQHSLTVSFINLKTGLEESITKKFVILATEENLGFTASVSAQPTNTSIPTIIPIQIPTSTPTTPSPVSTVKPGSTPSPTLAPTQKPTSTLTVTIRTAKPSTDSQVPTTGFNLPTVLPLIFSIPAIIIALILI
ncbi:hypothetical protein KKE45_01050 [Patescibacteria group bacterium]|nr:hypothetical protein [Patescibacteria group bacterium]